MRKFLYRALVFGSFTTFLGGLFVFGILIYFSFSLPKISSLADYKPSIRSTILSKDGVVLATIGRENREIVQFNDIPKRIVDAFLSAEDAGFYDHSGVDYIGVMRAFVANLKAGRVVQGGSTITQQVAKSLLLSSERSITRKIKDLLLAQKIEKRFSKEEILFLYLNQVYLGGGYYGIKTAFQGYFDKELSEATVAESALIAGLLVAPGKYSPYINPKYAKARQNYVLGRMLANGKITQDEYDEAVNEKIKYRLRKANYFKAGYFTEEVRQFVIEKVGEDNFLNNGFTVQTSLDYGLQKVAEEEIRNGAKAIDKRQGFKGPLKTLTPDKFLDFDREQRKEIYKDKANYFTIDDNYERVYEVTYDENELESILERKKEMRSSLTNSRFQIGNFEDDKIVNLLDKNELYQARVTYVDSYARIIYVSIGGAIGIIPYHYFRWAHERIITDDRHFYPFVTNPNSIVKVGDIIHVEIRNKSVSLSSQIWKSFRNYYQKSKDKDIIDKEKYLLCELEQRAEVQAALISLNPFNGEIVSMVGGTDFKKSKFNRSLQSKRQPGSSFKPLLFAAALESGYRPNTVIMDTPESLGGNSESLNWKPRNYDGKFRGPMTFRESLELSRNIPTIKIANDLGISNIFKFLDRIGFKADMPKDLSISLGSFGATLLDMVKAYSVFPNGGRKLTPKFVLSILDREGKEYIRNEDEIEVVQPEVKKVEEPHEEKILAEELEGNQEVKEEKVNPFVESLGDEQVYDKRLAYIMTNLLKGVVLYGTGKPAKQVSHYLGGKTGTTSSYVDAWFMGFSQNIVTGVWTGMDDNQTMGWGETGTKSALPIWKAYMKSSILKYGEADFKVPLGIINSYINKKTGKAADVNDPGAFLESFVQGTEPGNNEIQGFFEEKKKGQESEIFEDDDYYNNQ